MQKRFSPTVRNSKDFSELRTLKEFRDGFSVLHEEIVCLLNTDHKLEDTKKFQVAIFEIELALINFHKGLQGSQDMASLAECRDLMSRADRLAERLRVDNNLRSLTKDFDITKTFVCLFIAPVASYNLCKIYCSSKSHIPEVVPAIVIGTGLCLQHPSQVMRTWRAAKRAVTASGKAVKKGFIGLKSYSLAKKAATEAGFRRYAASASQRAKAVRRKVRKLMSKRGGAEPR